MKKLLMISKSLASAAVLTGSLTLSALCADASILTEEKDSKTGRVSLNMSEYGTQGFESVSVAGDRVATLFGGPILNVDALNIFSDNTQLSSQMGHWAAQVKTWAEKKCATDKLTKVSVSMPNEAKELEKSFLKQAGFEEKTLIYKISTDEAIKLGADKLGKIEDADPSIFALTSDSTFFSQAELFFGKFNKTMQIPGLFRASAEEVVKNDGKIYVYQSSIDSSIVAIMAFASFTDKDNNKSYLVDSIYVDESLRRNRIATQMIKKILQDARADSVKTLYWETGFGRQDAQMRIKGKIR